MTSATGKGRWRRLAAGLAGTIVSTLLCTASGPAGDERSLTIFEIHTKETTTFVFKRDGKYVPEGLEKASHVMRDWRRDNETRMDPALLDLIWEIHRELGSRQPVHLISGFRSPATNEGLRRAGGGQAKHSRHMTGQAADIHFPDIPAKQLRYSALIRERGGVGYYPTSAIPFVHVDTGNVRMWPRMPRLELAQLFPAGRSKYVPSDGRPITKSDYIMAVAEMKARGEGMPLALQRHLNGPPQQPPAMLASLGPAAPARQEPRIQTASLAPAAPPAREEPRLQTASLAPAAPASAPRPEPEPAQPEPAQPAPVALAPQPATPPDYSGRLIASIAPRPSRELDSGELARAPDYDDDHPDESNYQPVPIAPLLTDTPLAQADFTVAGAGPVKAGVLNEPAAVNIRFEPGPQYEGMYWAHRFTGRAVNSVLTKFKGSGSSSVAKAPGVPAAR